VSIVKFPDVQNEGSLGRTRFDTTEVRGHARHTPGRIGAALDVARTLLVLALIGTGIVMLRFLLVLARSAIGY
jgi:hypothetical protein